MVISRRISKVHKSIMLFLTTISSTSNMGELSSTSAIRARLSGFLSSFFLSTWLFVASIAPILSKFCFFLCGKTKEQSCIVWHSLWHEKYMHVIPFSSHSLLCSFSRLSILSNIFVMIWSFIEDELDDVLLE
jgi:hypothetical protein